MGKWPQLSSGSFNGEHPTRQGRISRGIGKEKYPGFVQ